MYWPFDRKPKSLSAKERRKASFIWSFIFPTKMTKFPKDTTNVRLELNKIWEYHWRYYYLLKLVNWVLLPWPCWFIFLLHHILSSALVFLCIYFLRTISILTSWISIGIKDIWAVCSCCMPICSSHWTCWKTWCLSVHLAQLCTIQGDF